MSEHRAKIAWERGRSDFTYETFDRTHLITFNGGLSITASSAPEFTGRPEYANPEEMLTASVASCHMLTFLAIAAKSKITVESYEDEPVATMEKNEQGQYAITRIRLTPRIRFGGTSAVSGDKLKTLHEKAHKNCFIANSVKADVMIEPRET